MPVNELYSTRNQSDPDLYSYDEVSPKLRNQLAHIVADAIGNFDSMRGMVQMYSTYACEVYQQIFNILRKEYGVKSLYGYSSGSYDWVEKHIGSCDVTEFIDIAEIICRFIDTDVRRNFFNFRQQGASQEPDDALKEINFRMRRDGFGYEYVGGVFIRVDSSYLHAEATKPALYLLSDFEVARGFFVSAHEHYRSGRFEESITDCNKSIESLLKEIFDNMDWTYNTSKSTVASLIPIAIDKGLFPSYLQTQLSALNNLVSTGVPVIRNNEAGHGPDSKGRNVTESLVGYTLHLTASNILFLGECYKDLIKAE